MNQKWLVPIFAGVVTAIASLLLSYVFPEVTGISSVIIIGVVAGVSAFIGYKLFRLGESG